MDEHLPSPDPGTDVVLVEYDPSWPAEYARQEQRIRAALGALDIEVHHAGSTSVRGWPPSR